MASSPQARGRDSGLRVTAVINLFMLAAEVFTELYTGGSHTASAIYLYRGLHGHAELVPWIWTAIAFNTVAALHELVPYSPSLNEWKVTAGIWALGLMVFTVALKIGLPAMSGKGIGGELGPGAEASSGGD